MKKLIVFIMLIMISPLFSCDDKADKNEFNPALLLLFGSNSLTVNVAYNGAYTVHGTYPGTQYVYVYLYNTRPVYTRSPVCVYSGSSSGAVTTNTPQAITIRDIAAGDYFLLVFYDYRSGDNADNREDRYILYNGTVAGTQCIAQATTVNISGVKTLDITFNDTYYFPSGASGGAGATFVACP